MSVDNTSKSGSMVGQAVGLVGWLVLVYLVAAIGATASINARDFYAELSKPDWAPPGWLFGPVWTVLYFLMGIAAWIVWRERGIRGAPAALLLFVVQLAANGLWSWLFFAWRQGTLSVAEIILLWCLILATTIAFWRINTFASLLLWPYLAWVGFASALTYSLWRANLNVLP